MSLKTQAISGVKWTSLSMVFTTGLQFFQMLFLARLLTPKDFGLMGMVMVVIGLAQAYSDMGISAAIIHKQDTTRKQLSSLYWLNIVSGVLVFIVLLIITPLAVLLFSEPNLGELIPLVALTLLISPYGVQFQVLLRKELKFNTLGKLEIIAAVAGAGVAILSALQGLGVLSLIWGQLTSVCVKTLLSVIIGWRYYKPLLHFSSSDLKGYIGFGLYQMGERSVNFLSQRLDQILIGSLLGAEAMGFYNLASNLVIQPIIRINPIITSVAFPVFAKMQNDIPQLRQGYLKVINFLMITNAPLLIGIAVVAPVAIPLILGSQWQPSVPLVQLLTIVSLSRCKGNPVGSLLLARGRADIGFNWNLILFITSSPVLYIGAKLGGAVGVAVALIVLQAIYTIPGYIYQVRAIIGPCAMSYAVSILKPVTLALLMGLGVWLMTFIGSASIIWLSIYIIMGGILYLGLLWVFDKAMLAELTRMLLLRKT